MQQEPKIPHYAMEALQEKETRIREIERSISHGVHFAFLTDYHAQKYNCGYSPALIAHLLEHTDMTHCIFGGDAVNHELSVSALLDKQADFARSFAFLGANFYTVIGNHEYYSDVFMAGSPKPTTEQVFAALCANFADHVDSIGPMGGWRLRRDGEDVCYLAVPCDFDCHISTDYMNWFFEQLLRIPQDCAVIVIGHRFVDECGDGGGGVVSDCLPICHALDALRAGTVFSYCGRTYDYSGAHRRRVVCILSGHTHDDRSYSTAGGIPVIVTTSDAGIRQDFSQDRTLGTAREQAFDMVDVDLQNGVLYLTRIGAGADRVFSF